MKKGVARLLFLLSARLPDGELTPLHPIVWNVRDEPYPDFLLLSGSVLENITLFEEEPDMERFKAAVRMAECEDVIDALPDGIDTFLGEGGGRLSGGQRQRMAIARALYSRAQVLLMDESTSALSADTEEKILRHLCHSGRTVIFVTHRDTVSALCDRVLHMQDGKITLQHE